MIESNPILPDPTDRSESNEEQSPQIGDVKSSSAGVRGFTHPSENCAAPGRHVGGSAQSGTQLLSSLRKVTDAIHGCGAGIYRVDRNRGSAEIVVGVGRGIPTHLSPLPDRNGLDEFGISGGRAWILEGGSEAACLFVATEDSTNHVPLPSLILDRLESAWKNTKAAPTLHEVYFRFPELLGQSPTLAHELQLVEKVAPTQVSVLILGESGTGKELIGKAIHRLSGRKGRFISENCAAISDTLLEGELFGAERGSYTGAHTSRKGLIEEASGGTLFLDEIGEMGPALQSKLLRVLQEREVRRIGSTVVRPVDFRLVTATHRDLDQQVDAGAFRPDLLFRIDVVRIALPPLREREGDVTLLARHFLQEVANSHHRSAPEISDRALQYLEGFPWPGNVRELRNEIERAFALEPDRIDAADLSPRLRQITVPHPLTRQIRDQIGCALEHLERIICGGVVREVLRETGGNKAEAARRLGIPKTNLYRRLERYGIPLDRQKLEHRTQRAP